MERSESDKFTHIQVLYEYPSTHVGQACVNCEHFIGEYPFPDRCEGVKSPIQENAWCKRWEHK